MAVKTRFSQLILSLVVPLLFLHQSGMCQLSPGDLARVHSSLEGITNCTKCHELGEGPAESKCLDCHKLIADRLESKKGFHHQAVNIDENGCFDCHAEHAGEEFDLVFWPDGREDFDHVSIGFPLLGSHARNKCRDCHHPGLIREDLKKREPDKDLTRTYLGLGTDCLSCHKDQHQGQLGNDCTQCHNQDKFIPANGFDHNRARFALTGRHARIDCEKCHSTSTNLLPTGVEVAYQQYTGLQFNLCTSCHQDHHQGRFGSNCEQCHSTAGWKSATTTGLDHDKTAFPLVGLHRTVKCTKCHGTKSLLTKIPHDQCADCHEDVHRGQLAHRANNGACDNCHTVYGFLPARFTISDHSETHFPLVGAHLAQPCIACHKQEAGAQGRSVMNFKMSSTSCESCHADTHRGQFKARGSCNACHSTESWSLASFDHGRDTEYPLTGAHLSIPCRSCHPQEVDANGSFVRFSPLGKECTDCHRVADNPIGGKSL